MFSLLVSGPLVVVFAILRIVDDNAGDSPTWVKICLLAASMVFLASAVSLVVEIRCWGGVSAITERYQNAVAREPDAERTLRMARRAAEYRENDSRAQDLFAAFSTSTYSMPAEDVPLSAVYGAWLKALEGEASREGVYLHRILNVTPLSVFRVDAVQVPTLRKFWLKTIPFDLTSGSHPAADLAEALLSGDTAAVHAVYEQYLYGQQPTQAGIRHVHIAINAAAKVLKLNWGGEPANPQPAAA